MPEYIEREALLNDLENSVVVSCKTENIPQAQRELNKIVSCIKQAPTADVAEVRHAHWAESEVTMNTKVVFCTNCFATYQFKTNDTDLFDYCPRCGAKMDKESENSV